MPYSVIYLGPSLELEAAQEVLPTRFLPPIRRGDILSLLRENAAPDAIGIVDGEFFQSFSISPKEVLVAIEQGIRVYGSSSMGALRAVELEPYGMTGIGRVFELYASGRVDADDEVAMTFDPETRRPLSVPLVNIRLALDDAVDASVVSQATAKLLVSEAKKAFYPERSFEQVVWLAERICAPEEVLALRGFLSERKPNAKRDDAIALLERVRDEVHNGGARVAEVSAESEAVPGS